MAKAAVLAAAALDEERSGLYVDLIYSRLGALTLKAVEELMQGKYEYQSDFARRYYGQGVADGAAAGEAKGLAEAVLELLSLREIAASDEVRASIVACLDVEQLKRWHRRAATATRIEDVID